MLRKSLLAAAIMSLVLLANLAAPAARAGSSVNLNAIARSVTQIAGVRENQIVLLTSDPTNYPFLEALAIQVRAAGAFPLIQVGSDDLNKRMFNEVPARYDSQSPLLSLALFRMIDTQISVDYGGEQDYDFFARADQNRLAAQSKAFAPALQVFYRLNRRFVDVGNGIFPNRTNARLFRVRQSSLASTFWNAMNSDYSKVQSAAAALRATIARGRTMRVTHPNGTDISFGVRSVQVIVSAGSIPGNCRGVACSAFLPAGDVVFIPVQGTATGKVVFDNTFWGKDLLKRFTATFASGKLTGMSSSSDLTKFKAAYAAGGNGRDAFTFVDLGVNNFVKNIPHSLMLATFAGGSTSLGFGGDLGLGGSNASPFAFSATQPGCTVTVDGRAIITDGKIVAGT